MAGTESFTELEQLWEEAGGSAALAPYAAATAENESSGIVDASNPSGATGLWQIEYPDSDVPGYSQEELLTNPLDNAKAAVALSKDTLAGLVSNWTQYEGKTEAQVEAEAAADQKAAGQAVSGAPTPNNANAGSAGTTGAAGTGTSGTPTTTGTPGSDSTVNQGQSAITSSGGWDPLGLLDDVTGLARDVATVIDYVFGMFGRGQGWRVVFTLAFAAAIYGAYRSLVATGAIPDLSPHLSVV